MLNQCKKVKIIEIGPRDGLQNEKQFLATRDKITLINQLAKAGFQEIEATSFVHPKWIPNLADAEDVIGDIKQLPVTFFALVPNEKGFNRALESGVDGITYVLSATDSHNEKNLNRKTIESIKESKVLVAGAEDNGLKVRASLSTVFGCPFEGKPELDRILWVINHLIESGFKRIGLCDTIGVANPTQVYEWMTRITKEFSDTEFELHFHNTYGRGLANVIAGIQAGVTAFDSSIGGLGGCPYAPGATGNISTEDVVEMLHEMGIETGINKEELMKASQLVNQFFNKDLDSQIWRVSQAIS